MRFLSSPTSLSQRLFVVVAGLAVSLLSVPAQATDRLVPTDYPTIQAAVTAAAEGDRIVLANGTYSGAGNYGIDLGTRNLSIVSASDQANACVIDCQQQGRAFRIAGGQTNATLIRGITIRNGQAPPSSTDQTDGIGGAIVVFGSRPTISNCVFLRNTAPVYGGGVGIVSANGATITDCTFLQNTSQAIGGGVAVLLGSATLTRIAFNKNSSELGGGLFISFATAQITNSAFTGNTATRQGGAIWINNVSGSQGVTITNGTFSNNQAAQGSALAANSSTVSVANSLFWSDAAPEFFFSSSTVTISNSDLEGGLPSGAIDGGGNIAADPQFVRAAFANGPEDTGDLRLRISSPCVDAGDSAALPPDNTTDLLGNPRSAGDRVDIGAHELPIVSGVDLQLTQQLTRDESTGQILVALTLTNYGSTTATDVTLTAASIANQSSLLSLPTTPTALARGQSTTLLLPFANRSAGERTLLRLTGRYQGGTFGSSFRITLP